MKHPSLKGKKVLVIGLGISGRAAAGFLIRKGALVTGSDQSLKTLNENEEVRVLKEKGLQVALQDQIADLSPFDLIVVSPGIPVNNPLYQLAQKSKIEMIGEVELAFRSINNKVLGITGTNGKTTTTLLVEHVLNASGIQAAALGNSGIALTSEEAERFVLSDVVVVAELSSYQLDTMNSKVLDAAVLLNITPDHLDRYGTMETYAKSKMSIANFMKDPAQLYIEEKCNAEYGHLLKGTQKGLYGFSQQSTIYTDGLQIYNRGVCEASVPASLKGKKNHDVENLLAAYALCRFAGVNPEQFMQAFATFKKPSHRVEFVRELHGVSYYDDSKGTNLDAVIKAVDMMAGDVILIAGGVDKGAAYTPWIQTFADKVKCILAIGQAAPKIENDLASHITVKRFPNLDSAVHYASQVAQPGSNVLLSPGCSSFDMFKDYAHRGKEFQRMVKSL